MYLGQLDKVKQHSERLPLQLQVDGYCNKRTVIGRRPSICHEAEPPGIALGGVKINL